MKIYVRLESPYEWVRVNGERVEAFGEVENISEFPIGDDESVIGVVPGEYVTAHRVSLPTKTKKQFNQALPFALEESLSEEVSEVYFVCPDWKPNSEVLVYSVARSKMLQWQTLANQNRIPIDQLLPEYMLLPEHEAADFSLAKVDDGLLAKQVRGDGIALDVELIDVWLMDVPVESTVAVNDEAITQDLLSRHPNRDFRYWEFGIGLRHWLEYESKNALNLWGDEYRPSVSRFKMSSILKPLALAGLSVFLFLAYDTFRYFSLKKEILSLDAHMVEILQETIPDASGIEGGLARSFMERALQAGQAQSEQRSVHATLADIANVLRQMRATLQELSYQNDEVVITCILSDFSQVDAITRRLNSQRNLSASLQGSSAEDDIVFATYVVKER